MRLPLGLPRFLPTRQLLVNLTTTSHRHVSFMSAACAFCCNQFFDGVSGAAFSPTSLSATTTIAYLTTARNTASREGPPVCHARRQTSVQTPSHLHLLAPLLELPAGTARGTACGTYITDVHHALRYMYIAKVHNHLRKGKLSRLMLHHKVHQKHASNQLPPCPQQTVSKVDKQLGNMPAQAALSTTLSTMLHKGVRLSHETKELSFRSVNMVHVKRPHVAVHEQPSRLLAKPTLQVCRCHYV